MGHNWSRLVGRYRILVPQLITVVTCATIDHSWLVSREYLCHNWSRLVGRYRIPVSQLITEMFPSSQSHSSHFPIHYLPTDIWHDGCHYWRGTANPSEAHEFTPLSLGCLWVRVDQSFIFCVVFCRLFFFHLSFSLCLYFPFGHCVVCPSSTYGFWLSDYPFSIFSCWMYIL
jgi:hypothetical protein